MTTVLSVHNSEGCVGRCDDKCHSATKTDCDCICGGLYHGTRANGTFEQVRRDVGAAIIASATKKAQEQGLELRASMEASPDLFDFIDQPAKRRRHKKG